MNMALNSSAGLTPVLFGLAGILLALRYLKDQSDFSQGISAVFYGFLCVFAAKLLIFAIPVFDEGSYYFVTLSLRLVSAVCLIAGALMIKGMKKLNGTVLIAAALCTVGWSWYVVGVLRDMNMLTLSFAVSTAGYGALAASLWNKKSLKTSLGFVLTGWMLIFIALFNLLDLFAWGRNLISPMLETFLYIGVTCGLILISNNLLAHRFGELVQEAEESKNRLRLMIQKSPSPIIISRLKDDRLMLINDKAGALFGLDVKHPGNFKTVDYLADPSSRRELLAKLEKKPVVDDFEILVKPRKGEPFWLLLSVRVIDFEYEIALYMAFQDITGRKKKEMKLFDQATRDPLTNCYNRRQFEELAMKEVQRSRRYQHPFCLFMIDADHFKNVNDTHGHAVGDLVLQALANCCRMTLRESDIVARFGGEEFVILLPEVSLENAHRVAERLRINISKIVVKNEQNEDVRFTVSIGLVSSEVTDNVEEMLKMADEALYVAKENGRNRVIIRRENGADKDTVAPVDDEIKKALEAPLYYFTPSSVPAPAPAASSAPVSPIPDDALPTAYAGQSGGTYLDDDAPLDDDDDEPAPKKGKMSAGVSLDDLYDDDLPDETPSRPASQSSASDPFGHEHEPAPLGMPDVSGETEPDLPDDDDDNPFGYAGAADKPHIVEEEDELPDDDDVVEPVNGVLDDELPDEDLPADDISEPVPPPPPPPPVKKMIKKIPAGSIRKVPVAGRVKVPKMPAGGVVPPKPPVS